jgi:hypothetical protein
MWYHVLYQGELWAQSLRAATQAVDRLGPSPDRELRIQKLFEDFLGNPDSAMMDAADRSAREGTFTLAPSRFAANLGAAIQSVPFVGTLLLPFYTTPDNILRFAFKRSPLNVLAKSVRDDIAAGGERQVMAYARMTAGCAVLTGAFALARAGKITGRGPSDPKEREAWLAAGNTPYSWKIGSASYTFNGLDPVALFLCVAADTEQLSREMSRYEDEGKDYWELASADRQPFVCLVLRPVLQRRGLPVQQGRQVDECGSVGHHPEPARSRSPVRQSGNAGDDGAGGLALRTHPRLAKVGWHPAGLPGPGQDPGG